MSEHRSARPAAPPARAPRRRLAVLAVAAALLGSTMVTTATAPARAATPSSVRVAIATDIDTLNPFLAILASSTAILLFSLDASVRGETLALLLRLKRDLGLGALVITHDLGLAWNIADRVMVMHQGRIVEDGTVEQVLLDPQDAYTKTLLSVVPSRLARR